MNLTITIINDLSRTHAPRTINYRHRRTLNRTLIYSVISRRFIVLPHTRMFHHPQPFLSRISPIIIRRTNSAVRKVSSTIAQYLILVTIYEVIYKTITLGNPDRIIPVKNKDIKGNWYRKSHIVRDWTIFEIEKSHFKNRILNISSYSSSSVLIVLARQMNDVLQFTEFSDSCFFV